MDLIRQLLLKTRSDTRQVDVVTFPAIRRISYNLDLLVSARSSERHSSEWTFDDTLPVNEGPNLAKGMTSWTPVRGRSDLE